MRTKISGALLGFLALVQVATVDAQEETQSPGFFDTVEVNVVEVEAYVTDKNGVPVVGLTPDDFEVLEDGKPVDITNFYSMQMRRPAASYSLGEGGELFRDVEPIPVEQRLHLVIVLDQVNITVSNRTATVRAVAKFLRHGLQPEDRVVIMSYDGRVNVERELTGDAQEIEDTLHDLIQRSARGRAREMTRRSILRDLNNASTGDENLSEARGVYSAIKIFADQEADEVRRAVQALKGVVDAASGLRGRKAVLFVSGGLSIRPGEALHQAFANKFGALARQMGIFSIDLEAAEHDTMPLFNELADHANASQVTFYSLGAGEGGGSYSVTAEEGSFDLTALSTPGGGRSWNSATHAVQNLNRAGSLQYLAATTGGLAMVNGRAFDEFLSRVRKDLDVYYSIGYRPVGEADGKKHNIEVRVLREGLKVRHRSAYRSKTRSEHIADRTTAALLLADIHNPLEMKLEFGKAQVGEKKRHRIVPVMVKVPLANLTLVPQGAFHVGSLELFVTARDEQGRTSGMQKIPVPIRISNDDLVAARGQVAGYRILLAMREGRNSVAVGVLDELGSSSSTVRVDYDTRHGPVG